MYHLQIRRYEMLTRIYRFCTESPDLVPSDTLAPAIFTRIGDVLEELKEAGANQIRHFNSSRGFTHEKVKVTAQLREHLGIMVQTARLIARTIPRFDERFPPVRGRSDASLLYSARLFGERAAADSDAFIRYAMPPNFIDTLNAQIQKVEQVLLKRSDARTALKEATAAIDAALKKGMSAVAELDVVIANTLRGNPSMLAVWKRDRHVPRAPRKKAAAATAGEGTAAE